MIIRIIEFLIVIIGILLIATQIIAPLFINNLKPFWLFRGQKLSSLDEAEQLREESKRQAKEVYNGAKKQQKEATDNINKAKKLI